MKLRSQGLGLVVARAGAASVVALIVAGCTTTSGYDETAYASAVYPGADRLYRNGYVEATRPLSAAHAAAAVESRTLAAYEGIEGARLAHEVYAEAQAERLDGACERYVKIEQGETLYDIASLCDVPVYMLMDYNPSVDSPRFVHAGQTIEVPYIVNHDRLSYVAGAGLIQPVAEYVIQPGDTLGSIAATHLAPADWVAELNPGIDWRAAPIGMTIKIPASAPAVGIAAAPLTPRKKPMQSYLGDGDFGGGSARDGAATNYNEIEGLMPYRLRPHGAPADTAGANGDLLKVSKSLINAGGVVWVSAEGLPPNADVTISSGANRAALETVETVRTGPDGSLNARVRVKRSADIGGVVFTATVDRTGETLYSERVGVLRIDGETSDATSNDDLEELED